MLGQQDLCPAGILCDAVDHHRDGHANSLEGRLPDAFCEGRGNLTEHLVPYPVPGGNQQLVAGLEVFIEVAVVQAGPGANAPHGDCGPTAFAPDLGRGIDQTLPTFRAAFRAGTPAPSFRLRPHISILTKQRRSHQTDGMCPQWWLVPPVAFEAATESTVRSQQRRIPG